MHTMTAARSDEAGFDASVARTKRKPKPPKPPAAPLLPPENPIDVLPPGTSGETVNQRRMREFLDLQNEFVALRKRYLAAYAKIQDLILHGAEIQSGQYRADYGVRYVRRPRYKQIVIDLKGEAYQKRVLESTAPHAHFRVRIE